MSIELVKQIYKFCELLPYEEKYIIIPQLKKAAISIASNIAEGYARKSYKETIRFLDISRSSLVEIDTQVLICIKLNYVQYNDIIELSDLLNYNFAMLTKLIKSITNS